MSACGDSGNYRMEVWNQPHELFFHPRSGPWLQQQYFMSLMERQWPPEIEEFFIWTVNYLGWPYRATPAMVVQTMWVPGLTITNVTCYLVVQIYRMMIDNNAIIGGMEQFSPSFVNWSFLAPPRYFGPPGSGVSNNSTYAFYTHPRWMHLNYMLPTLRALPGSLNLSLPSTQSSPSVNENWTPLGSAQNNEVRMSNQPDLDLSLGIGSGPQMFADADSIRYSRDENGGLDLSLSLGLPNVTSSDIAELEARERYEVGECSHLCEFIVIDDD